MPARRLSLKPFNLAALERARAAFKAGNPRDFRRELSFVEPSLPRSRVLTLLRRALAHREPAFRAVAAERLRYHIPGMSKPQRFAFLKLANRFPEGARQPAVRRLQLALLRPRVNRSQLYVRLQERRARA